MDIQLECVPEFPRSSTSAFAVTLCLRSGNKPPQTLAIGAQVANRVGVAAFFFDGSICSRTREDGARTLGTPPSESGEKTQGENSLSAFTARLR